MSRHATMLEVRYPDKPPRYFVNGRRVPVDHYNLIREQALMFGRLDCFSTKAVQVNRGKFKRFNYSHAVY